MSDRRDNGRPAFPSHGSMGEVTHEGMTLRDYFAAKAMAAFICEPVEGTGSALFYDIHELTCAAISSAAYKMADAMLEKRAE